MKKITIYFKDEPKMELDGKTNSVYVEDGIIYISSIEKPFDLKYMIPITEIQKIKFD